MGVRTLSPGTTKACPPSPQYASATPTTATSSARHFLGREQAAPSYDSDPAGQLRRVFALAREYDVDIDLHLDFEDRIWTSIWSAH